MFNDITRLENLEALINKSHNFNSASWYIVLTNYNYLIQHHYKYWQDLFVGLKECQLNI